MYIYIYVYIYICISLPLPNAMSVLLMKGLTVWDVKCLVERPHLQGPVAGEGSGVAVPDTCVLLIRCPPDFYLSVCASIYAGVRGADQTYNQRRTRFLNAKKGAYK